MDNTEPNGGIGAFQPIEGEALPAKLKEAGYATGYIGRYLTGYDGSYSPPGWDWWQGMALERADFIGFSHDGKNAAGEHHDDFMAREAASFIERTEKPFYLQVATLSPHRIYPEMATTYPERYADAFPNLTAPRPSSFNEEDVSDKPAWIRDRRSLSDAKIAAMDHLYRDQARAMLAVDDTLGTLRRTLKAKGALTWTYIIFTSDNGYHLGLHRLPEGKWTAYEHDIRVPLYVRGLDVVAGQREQIISNNDLAPTVADLAGASLPFQLQSIGKPSEDREKLADKLDTLRGCAGDSCRVAERP